MLCLSSAFLVGWFYTLIMRFLPNVLGVLIALRDSTSSGVSDPWPVSLLYKLRGEKCIDDKGYTLLLQTGRFLHLSSPSRTEQARTSCIVDLFLEVFLSGKRNVIKQDGDAAVDEACKIPWGEPLLTKIAKLLSIEKANEFKILNKMMEEGLIGAQHPSASDICGPKGDKAALSYTCPPDGTPFKPIDWTQSGKIENRKKMDEAYSRLLLNDCVVIANIRQIALDAPRVKMVATPLFDLIKSENSERSERSENSIQGTRDPPSSEFAEQTASVLTEDFKSSEIEADQFKSEVTQMIDICSEVSLVYSSFGRNSNSMLTFTGRSIPDYDEFWKKYSYPKKENIIPFYYNQGMMNVCYYLLFFSRVPASQSSPKGSPATFPSKHQVYNMIAAIVEDVSDMPLGDRDFGSAFYSNLSLNLIQSDYQSGFFAFIDAMGITDFNLEPGVVALVWKFIFTNGHHGLMAFIVACFEKLEPAEKENPDFGQHKITHALQKFGRAKIIETIVLAQSFIGTPDWIRRVDLAECSALEETRPTTCPDLTGLKALVHFSVARECNLAEWRTRVESLEDPSQRGFVIEVAKRRFPKSVMEIEGW
jgi:hypothetical protein